MSLIKLSSLATQLARRNLLQSQNRRTFKTDQNSSVQKADDDADDDEVDKPIRYSTSPAASWTAANSQSGADDDEVPDCQAPIVIISVTAFLLYFLIFREPNDIDEIFDKELGDHVEHIDIEALKRSAGIPMYDQEKKYTK
ncbi:hypothetical protein PV325_008702 [Microctonus aethiopoides]|nr:hypothetical protein PV325_008702 [Microctonus aethiopoides]